jgi:hypothetical protein
LQESADPALNSACFFPFTKRAAPGMARIDDGRSNAMNFVIPTDEERRIALHTLRLLKEQPFNTLH